jgi:hypothetical protein
LAKRNSKTVVVKNTIAGTNDDGNETLNMSVKSAKKTFVVGLLFARAFV